MRMDGQTQIYQTLTKCGSKKRQIVKSKLNINQRYKLYYDLYGQNFCEYKSHSVRIFLSLQKL